MSGLSDNVKMMLNGDNKIRLGLIGVAGFFILIGSSLLWNYQHKSQGSGSTGPEKDGNASTQYFIFTSWIFIVCCAGALLLRNSYKFQLLTTIPLLLIVMTHQVGIIGADSATGTFSHWGTMTLVRKQIDLIGDSNDELKHELQKALAGGVLNLFGFYLGIAAVIAQKPDLNFNITPELISLGAGAVLSFLGCIILWSCDPVANPLYGTSSRSGGSSADPSGSFLMYSFTSFNVFLVVLTAVALFCRHRAVALFSFVFAAYFSLFGLSYALGISASCDEKHVDQGRAGALFVWFSYLALTVSAYFASAELEPTDRELDGYAAYDDDTEGLHPEDNTYNPVEVQQASPSLPATTA
ncbi:uncharacterized protein MONBRDRAFT_36087 [Monosiga brevicollis MX1]|uniref:Uncharacterized protein n=1 Tax=Monosiga brevicollis TaxID=81824 RepID=A9UT05_MONBE|nr:uncharacterized protein MONBRDRAFT_36087 [Monosiga brevicollis MX1]EDQ91412.1 predicted protein [Monosiga brevicollis MX1]|eukprot:XP_001743834.1 hypothetical protein [Monosiga brevicollis MX1]